MSTQLLLRLPDQAHKPVLWVTYQRQTEKDKSSNAQDPIKIISSGVFSSVAAFENGFRAQLSNGLPIWQFSATVLIPATNVTMHSLALTGKLTPSVRQSLPWRLEDELADDVDNLHVCVLAHENEEVHLAVTSNRDMRKWMKWLEVANIQPRSVMPDALMLPLPEEDQAIAAIIDKTIVAHTAPWKMLACEPDMFALQRQMNPDLHWNFASSNHPLELFVALSDRAKITLLQGQWKPTSNHLGGLKKWRSIAAMGAVAFTLSVTNTWMQVNSLEQKVSELNTQSMDVYKQLFPGEKIIRLASQMQQKLNALKTPTDTSESMLVMFTKLAPMLARYPDLKALSLKYDGVQHTLRIDTQASNFELFTQIREFFDKEGLQQGLSLKVGALERHDKVVQGELIITGVQL